MKNWYLLTAKPHKDAIAEEQLNNQQYETYRPLARRIRRRQGKMIETIESLFPRYIFIRLDNKVDNWAPIRSTRGVAGFVRFGIEPAFVDDGLIELLKQRQDEYSENAIDLDRYKKGEKLIIETGPFKGIDAIFHSYNGEERAIVLLNMLHKQTKLEISPAEISKI